MSILAFDPSKTCTGWAVLQDDGSPDGELVEAGTIKPAEKPGQSPSIWIADVHHQVCKLMHRICPSHVAVEFPFCRPRGGPKSKRSDLTLPTYGMGVCAVVCGVNAWFEPGKVECVPVDTWARGMPKDDEYKTWRVRMAAQYYNRQPEEFGPKTIAGNVADAVLLARWVLLNKVRRAKA